MLDLLKTLEGSGRHNQALNRGERIIAVQIDNQPAPGEIVDGVRDVLR